jgi:hypothetical protein
MKKSISELLKSCAEVKKVEERVEALKVAASKSPALLTILKYAFDPNIKFLLPDTDPPYKPSEFLDQEGRLYTELRRLYLFIDGGNPNLTKFKREMLFIQLLESVDKNDAVLLCSIKNKKLPYKELTSKIVLKAFPGLFPEE